MKEGQKDIYYAIAHDKASADKLPQMDLIKAKGYDALILSDDVDEFMIQILKNYNDHEFKSINKDDLNLISEEESKEIDKKQEDNKELLDEIKKVLTDAKDVKLSKRLVDAPCCVSTDGEITFEMERVLKQQNHDIKAERVFELNPNHPMFEKIKDAFKNDKELAKKYVNVLYAEALLQEGILPNDIMQFNKDITELLLK
jgi:molecular chaperone HtpG